MSRLQEARDLLAATEGHTPAPFWDYGTPGIESNGKPMLLGRTLQEFVDGRLAYSAPALRDLLSAMVAEVERFERLTLADKQCHDCGGMNLSHYDGRNVCQQCGWSAVDG